MKGAGTLEEMEHHPQGKRCLARPTPFPGPATIISSRPESVPARRLGLPLLLARFLATTSPGNGLAVGQLLQVPYTRPGAVAVQDDRQQPVSHEDGRELPPSLDKLAKGNGLPVNHG